MYINKQEIFELTLQFEAFFEAYPDAFVKINRNGEILQSKLGKLAAFTEVPELEVGKNFAGFLKTEDGDKVFNALKTLNIGSVIIFNVPYVYQQYTYYYEGRIVPFYKNQFIIFLRDQTEKAEMGNMLTYVNEKEGFATAELAENFSKKCAYNNQENKSTDFKILVQKTQSTENHANLEFDLNLRIGMQDIEHQYMTELKQKAKELEHFRYMASHEFQTKLNDIVSNTKSIRYKSTDNSPINTEEKLDEVISTAEKLKTLISNISDFARFDYSHEKPSFLFIEDIIQVAEERLSKIIGRYNAKIYVEEKMPCVFGSRNQLIKLLENLIENAIKFSKKDVTPEIFIKAEENTEAWTFYVKDNGIGFNPKWQEKIFNMFQRYHSEEGFDGAGIGLALCKKIVDNHAGTIWAETQPGQGSVFAFTLNKPVPQDIE